MSKKKKIEKVSVNQWIKGASFELDTSDSKTVPVGYPFVKVCRSFAEFKQAKSSIDYELAARYLYINKADWLIARNMHNPDTFPLFLLVLENFEDYMNEPESKEILAYFRSEGRRNGAHLLIKGAPILSTLMNSDGYWIDENRNLEGVALKSEYQKKLQKIKINLHQWLRDYSKLELPSWGSALQFPLSKGSRYAKKAFSLIRKAEASKRDPLTGDSRDSLLDAYALFGHSLDSYLNGVLDLDKKELFRRASELQTMPIGHFLDIYGPTAEFLHEVKNRTAEEDEWLYIYSCKLSAYSIQPPRDFNKLIEKEYSKLGSNFVETINVGEDESALFLDEDSSWKNPPLALDTVKSKFLRAKEKFELWFEHLL